MKEEWMRNGKAVVARKKAIEIDAFHMKEGRFSSKVDWPDWMHRAWGDSLFRRADGGIGIHTLEGDLNVSLNDWIIRGIKGELYLCKPDIFEATYEITRDAYHGVQ